MKIIFSKTACIIICIILLADLTAIYANDSAIDSVGGTIKALEGEHLYIRMVSETIYMDISPEYYDVKAEFVFYNDGDATTVKMGFPEEGRSGGSGPFIYFKTTVDDRQVTAKRMPISFNTQRDTYSTYWVKEVFFNRKQSRKVKVLYSSKIGTNALPGIYAVYNFTGGNWKGTVNESLLTAVWHLNSNYKIYYGGRGTAFYNKNGRKEVVQKGNKIFFKRTNWNTEGILNIVFKKKK